jgi:thiamine biosynthesis protein ThiS
MPELRITVNGEERHVPGPCSVEQLLGILAVDNRRVAVERNLDVVPRARHASTWLAEGDQLEVVTFVGGG